VVLSPKLHTTIRHRTAGQHSDEVKKSTLGVLLITWFWRRGVSEHASSASAPTAKPSPTPGFSALDFHGHGHSLCPQEPFLWLVRDDSASSESFGAPTSASQAKPQHSRNSPLLRCSMNNCSLLRPLLISATHGKARNDKYCRQRLCKKPSKEIARRQTREMLEIMRKLRATGKKN